MAPAQPQANAKEIKDFFGMSLTDMKAEWAMGGPTARLTPAERLAVEAYLARLTRNVRDLAGRLEGLRADLRQPRFPCSPARSIECPP